MRHSSRAFFVAATLIMAAIAAPWANAAETKPKPDSGKPAKGNDLAPLGSPDFYPSAAHPIGWRGDGTGCYPGATPPTTWSRTEKGERKNIRWETKLPCYSWATPIIVGDKIFVRSEPYDLFCLDKNSGKILWVRSHPAVMAATDAERKANPALNDIGSLLAEQQTLNEEFKAQGWSKALYDKRHELQKKIEDASVKADKKYQLPPDQYVESWTGYTAATPCSDGQNIYFTSGNGITACYDLDGKKKWARYESQTPVWGEHGAGFSPALSGDVLLVQTVALHAFDKTTGTELWTKGYEGNIQANCILPFHIGEHAYALYQGNIIRVKDGTALVTTPRDVGGWTQLIHDDTIFFAGSKAGIWKMAGKPTGEISMTPLIQEEYNRVNLPCEENPSFPNTQIGGFYVSTPLYHDGLLYNLGVVGHLTVVDTTKTKQADAIVYHMFAPFTFKNGFGRKTPGFGAASSPTFAGKYIYLMDSAGCTLVIEPGRTYKEIAKNIIDETVPDGWEQKYWMGPHHEQTEASQIFEGKRLYIRGEQYLYCVEEKK